MGSMKLEQHLYFPSGLKISSRTERLHSAWVRSKSGGKILAMRLARHWEDRSLSPASRGWWAGQRQSSLVSKSEALAPVVSASTVLISSSPHASRGHTKPRHPSSPAGEPAVPGAERKQTTRSLRTISISCSCRHLHTERPGTLSRLAFLCST